MANKIYKVEKGVRRELSSREIKQTVMKLRGWDGRQYEKEYDKLRNRLRNYEAYKQAHGEKIKPQSPATILYYESRLMRKLAREGKQYTPSYEMQRLRSFTSASTGRRARLSDRQDEAYAKRYAATTLKQFENFIATSPVARRIVDTIKDPVKREQALKDYADELHLKIKESDEAQKDSAIPFDSIGSDIDLDFDLQEYMTKSPEST